jgi:hypothetical protein
LSSRDENPVSSALSLLGNDSPITVLDSLVAASLAGKCEASRHLFRGSCRGRNPGASHVSYPSRMKKQKKSFCLHSDFACRYVASGGAVWSTVSLSAHCLHVHRMHAC